MYIAPAFLVPFAAFSIFSSRPNRPTPPEQPKVCFCHDLTTNPVTTCYDATDHDAITKHIHHIAERKDEYGKCEEVPSVPEFNMLTGGLALITSAGSYIVWKRKMRKI